MDKIANFKKLVKEHRHELEQHGFGRAAINSWIYTDRVPTYENACLLADVLHVLITDIPYYQIRRVI
jgi:hypothetical protein